MEKFMISVKRAASGRLFKYFTPFVILVVGGTYGLKEFATLRYQFRRQKRLTQEELDDIEVPMKPSGSVTIETEFEKLKEMDIDTWENIRGPRPWEDSEYNRILKEKALKAKEKLELKSES